MKVIKDKKEMYECVETKLSDPKDGKSWLNKVKNLHHL
jgi:hypothetical protein